MIFVILGSQKNQFDRLLKAIDDQVLSGEIDETVFAQIGYSDYAPQHYSYRKFLDHDDFEKMEEMADLVITHGGTGAIMGALKKGKKVIAVPRRFDLGEHNDDHQIQIVRQFAQTGVITCCEDTDTLGDVIKEVRSGTCQEYHAAYRSNTAGYLDEISAYIDSIG